MLRRLRPHEIIERIPKTQRYRLPTFGLKTAVFCSRTDQRQLFLAPIFPSLSQK